jgi:putative membrane protein
MMNGMDHTWGMGWIWIIGLIALVIVIWMIVRVVNQKKIPDQPANKTPMDILNERYAKGEISKDEYTVKKKAIS